MVALPAGRSDGVSPMGRRAGRSGYADAANSLRRWSGSSRPSRRRRRRRHRSPAAGPPSAGGWAQHAHDAARLAEAPRALGLDAAAGTR